MENRSYKHKRIGGRAGKLRLAHHIIWEERNGPIPEGFEVHHLDLDKKNNDIENLQLLSFSDHQRIHSPWLALLDGQWVRICRRCKGISKTVTKRPTCDACRAAMGRIERRKNGTKAV